MMVQRTQQWTVSEALGRLPWLCGCPAGLCDLPKDSG